MHCLAGIPGFQLSQGMGFDLSVVFMGLLPQNTERT